MERWKRQAVLLEDLYDKPVSMKFTQPHQTFDGGVILLDAIDQNILIHRMAQAIRNRRQPGKIMYVSAPPARTDLRHRLR